MGQIYSQLKLMLFAEQLASFRARGTITPVHVRIKPYNRCNHNCWYCAYRKEGLQLGEEMNEADALPTDKFQQLVADLADMNVRAVTFSGGGEPTLHRDLPQAIASLAGRDIRIGCLTNGSTLDRSVGDALAEHATWLRVSVDAWDDDSYNRARGLRGAQFTKLLAAMRRFADRKKTARLGVSFIITAENAPHIALACEKFRDAGVESVKLSAVVTSNASDSSNAYHADARRLVAAEIEKSRTLEGQGFSISNHYHDVADRFDKRYRRCGIAGFLTVVGADQKIYFCQDKAYTREGCLGDFSDASFRDVWMSAAVQEKLLSFDPSTGCKHHCVANQKNIYLNELASLDDEHIAFV